MRTLRSALGSLGRSPVKASVMLATVGLGVAALIFALAISSAFARAIEERLEGTGLVVMVQIDSPDPTGRNGIPAGDVPKIMDTLVHDVTEVALAGRVEHVYTNLFVAGTATYEIRSVLNVSDEYVDIMNLDLIAGSRFTAGSSDALISASLAGFLFGSPAAALGQPLQGTVPRIEVRGNVPESAALIRDRFSHVYTVRGVFADPEELRRRAYGIADMLVGPEGKRAIAYSGLQFVVRMTSGRLATVESRVRAAIAAQFGDDLSVELWEGEPFQQSGVLEQIRSNTRTFALLVNLLAVLLLATGGVGLLSVMVVEVLSRSRQIAPIPCLRSHEGGDRTRVPRPVADHDGRVVGAGCGAEPVPVGAAHRAGGADLPGRDRSGSDRPGDHAGCGRRGRRGIPRHRWAARHAAGGLRPVCTDRRRDPRLSPSARAMSLTQCA